MQIGRRHPAEHTFSQRFDDVSSFDEGCEHQTITRTTIFFRHDEILCDIDKTPREIARIGGLQRSVGQAFASAVRGDEVLKDIETLSEVCGDWCLDNRSVGLGHQTAHTRELANLRRGTTCSRVGHHVDRVERLLLDVVAVLILDGFSAKLLHHRLGYLLIGIRPDVDNLVVTLALRHQTRCILILDLLHRLLSDTENRLLLARHHHVLDTDGHTGPRRVAEARVHELVGENDRFLQSHPAVAGVDQR